ncbi:MAG: hypothetical protein LBF08_01435 [Dysgonamonadaceae bacterium]|jgi:hypothetical protein|nr:hypothetical protein [Dysgonamonadaceae bacterium]
MIQTFTLIPVGGLGNRFEAMSSILCFCREKRRNLEIIWFKDHGLNCDFDKLFYIDPRIENVKIRNAKGSDFVLRDNPRRRNLWVPRLFENFIYDKCIYYQDNNFSAHDKSPKNDVQLDSFRHIYIVACGVYWKSFDMYNYVCLNDNIEKKVCEITSLFPRYNIIGIHIRRTDNRNTIKHSPTNLFIEAMNQEIENDENVRFFLASDSLEEKIRLINLYGDRIITSMKEVKRDTEEGIIDAFVEINVLSRTKKLYAGNSSYARISASLSGIEMKLLTNETHKNHVSD